MYTFNSLKDLKGQLCNLSVLFDGSPEDVILEFNNILNSNHDDESIIKAFAEDTSYDTVIDKKHSSKNLLAILFERKYCLVLNR